MQYYTVGKSKTELTNQLDEIYRRKQSFSPNLAQWQYIFSQETKLEEIWFNGVFAFCPKQS